jgi:hypothetical protein
MLRVAQHDTDEFFADFDIASAPLREFPNNPKWKIQNRPLVPNVFVNNYD